MDANRTYLLAQNGMPGEYIVSHTFIARAPPSQSTKTNKTMQRRDSADSLDSLARAKEEAQTSSPGRTGLRSALSKVARRLSGAGEEKRSTAGRIAVAEGATHEPFQVYVVGDQVVNLGLGSNRRNRKGSEKTKRLEFTDAGKERTEGGRERKMSTGPWNDGDVARDARVMRHTN